MKSEFIWDLSASKNQKHVSTSNIFNSLFVSLEIKPNNYRATPFTLFGLKCEQHRYAHFKNRELRWIKANMEIFSRTAVFAWLWLVVGANLLWENSTANWLVAGGWCWFSMREQYRLLVGWQAKRTERIKRIKASIQKLIFFSSCKTRDFSFDSHVCKYGDN